MKKALIFLVITFVFQACAIFRTPGFTSGYKRLTAEEQKRVCYVSSVEEIPDKNNGRIMAVTAEQLSALLKNNDTTLLYLWSPHCSSSSCVSLKAIQDYCGQAHLPLWVLTEYYTDAFTQIEFLSRPMLSVNEFRYKTNYCNSYMKRFLSELIPDDKRESNSNHRFLLFSRGSFVQSYDRIEDVIP
ncbi:MAG: hypothetical protein IKU03_06885 [Bacteroidales bacterium]|nr:hypothetical protein [Bacteroidales bacterium]